MSVFLLASGFLGCTALPATEASDPIRLRWLGGGEDMSDGQAEDALRWALSDLGAVPDDAAIRWSGGWVELDSAGLGLEWYATDTLAEATRELNDSGEAEKNGAVDLGRWLMRTLYNPLRYYAITGACRQFSTWAPRLVGGAQFGVTESLSFETDRLITFLPSPQTWETVRFAVAEGEGSLSDGSFAPVESETVDLLPNGQPRYAIYDSAGDLVPTATTIPAGQPGKCMWCHEAGLMHPANQLGTGVSYTLFENTLLDEDEVINQRRRSVDHNIDFDDWAELHTFAEALVAGFLNPTPERVAAEWGQSVDSVQRLGLHKHDVEEYGWTGRYARADVDPHAPYDVVAVPTDVRDAVPDDEPEPERLGAGCPEENL